ncbi:MAG TPA: fatty acid desaturase [Tepidisphaeraceae bacterium]|jgi:fatty acid desaturase
MKTDSTFWAHSRWDVIPALAGLAHLAYVIFLFWAFPRLSWWALIPLGLVYSISISWNINGVSHNFLHNRFFRWGVLNRLFSLIESLTCGFSQVFYESVHRRHHMGNADRPDETGETIDPLSIYKHGHDGEPENPWTYVFLSYFRDDPRQIFRDVRRLFGPTIAWWGVLEIVAFMALYTVAGILNWRFICYFLPFYYFGHCLSYLNGYYLHFGGKPDLPLAWGVSSYHRLYNWLWFNNGYHAEHHYRPRVHWTRMKALHEELVDKQRDAGTRVIKPPHALGFLEPTLPESSISRSTGAAPVTE